MKAKVEYEHTDGSVEELLVTYCDACGREVDEDGGSYLPLKPAQRVFDAVKKVADLTSKIARHQCRHCERNFYAECPHCGEQQREPGETRTIRDMLEGGLQPEDELSDEDEYRLDFCSDCEDRFAGEGAVLPPDGGE